MLNRQVNILWEFRHFNSLEMFLWKFDVKHDYVNNAFLQ